MVGFQRRRPGLVHGYDGEVHWPNGSCGILERDPIVQHANRKFLIAKYRCVVENSLEIVKERLKLLDPDIFNPSTTGLLDRFSRALLCGRIVAGTFDGVAPCFACDQTKCCLRCRWRRAAEIADAKVFGGSSFQLNEEVYHCVFHIPETHHPNSEEGERLSYEFIASSVKRLSRFLSRSINGVDGHEIVMRQIAVHPKLMSNGCISPHIHMLICMKSPSNPTLVEAKLNSKWEELTGREFGVSESVGFSACGDRIYTEKLTNKSGRRNRMEASHLVNTIEYIRRCYKPKDSPRTIARHSKLCEEFGINPLGLINGDRVELSTAYHFHPARLGKQCVIVFEFSGQANAISVEDYDTTRKRLEIEAKELIVNQLQPLNAFKYFEKMPKRKTPKPPYYREMKPVPEQVDAFEEMCCLANSIAANRDARDVVDLLTPVMLQVDHRVRLSLSAKWIEWERVLELALRQQKHPRPVAAARNTFTLGKELILRFLGCSRHRLDGLPACSALHTIVGKCSGITFQQLMVIAQYACVKSQSTFDPIEWQRDVDEANEIYKAARKNFQLSMVYGGIAVKANFTPEKLANFIKRSKGEATSGRRAKGGRSSGLGL
ncbi:hypothetical protein [Rhodopirellula sp. MGV]|uniref:hypothetical protein n=1 Tax=Rhodopirellula sp. MGV TaxID=2023130 RepID=UPI000B977561|nr:hypothetical protein [Rhodopirellula sp. MGV]OYP33962.1 hypothetical protein CGZ80_17465 [Rhodopirellula sp. MGV]PNY33529.1 hypothetical protein C2E31_27970 [Rhodopirellula baltica]